MGRTSKPLSILALPPTNVWDEVIDLAAQGHLVHDVSDPKTVYDIIMGGRCHRMSEGERKWLGLAIKEARRRRYPKDNAEENEE